MAYLAQKLAALANQSYCAVKKNSPILEEVRYYAKELLRLSEQRQAVLEQMVELAQSLPEYEILLSIPSVVIPTLERFCLSVFTTSLRLAILILAILQTSMRNEKDNRKQLQRSHIRLPLYIALFGQCITS